MRFLLDTDICSAHMRRPASLAYRFIQYQDQRAISAVGFAELYAGAYKHSQVVRIVGLIEELTRDVRVLDFDSRCAEWFGKTRGPLLPQGLCVATADLMIAATALAHDLPLVTHNRADYLNIPVLRLVDWLAP